MTLPQPHYSISCTYLTHRGAIRPANEDALLCGETVCHQSMEKACSLTQSSEDSWLLAVADGVGGNLAGERASKEVVEKLSRQPDLTLDGLKKALHQLNQHLLDLSQQDTTIRGLATTVAGLGSGPEGLFVFHIGDSRVYRQNQNHWLLLTQDDCVGELLKKDMEDSPLLLHPSIRRALTQCLGGQHPEQPFHPHIQSLHVTSPTRFLICSDGLSETLSHPQLEEILPPTGSLHQLATDLFDQALEHQARDNVSFILCEVTPLPS